MTGGVTMTLLQLTADHLWQSTLLAAGIALLTLAFRRHRAAVRYWLWLAASLKFLVPFAGLIALGTSVGWTHAPLPQPTLRLAVDVAAQPFAASREIVALAAESTPATGTNAWLTPSVRAAALPIVVVLWACGTVVVLLRWSNQWIRLRRLIARGTALIEGREAALLRRTALPRVSLVAVDGPIEPGIIGIFRPVLLWPASISARLDDEQIQGIFAHELAHVRRRDNLTAAVHMLIEAVFWFHPLVWWLGARLLDERERACDEDVLRGGGDPARYAESILRTCECYFETPLPCVTGVAGANLKNRIETIMRHHPASTLGRARTLLLSTFAVTAIAAPITVGVMRAPRLLAQSSTAADTGARFEAVSIKRNTSGAPGGLSRVQGQHYSATNITLRQLILNAYGVLQSQLVGESPLIVNDFLAAEHFDIEASLGAQAGPGAFPEMLRAMLADRFRLVAHAETRDMPVYGLVMARPDGRLGPQLKPADDKACVAGGPGAGVRGGGPPPVVPTAPAGPGGVLPAPGGGVAVGGRQQQGPQGCGTLQFGPGTFTAKSARLDMLVNSLANRAPLTGIDRVVLDRTDLTGLYDFELKWRMPVPPPGAGPAGNALPPVDPDRPDLFTALQEQLGLKLEPQRAPIQVIVIDSVQMPTEN